MFLSYSPRRTRKRRVKSWVQWGDDEEIVVRLDQDDIQCGICFEPFKDTESTDETARGMLPVLGSCGHYFCHGCIIELQNHGIGATDGAIRCPKCMQANQFVPRNPTYRRILIGFLLQRAQPPAAVGN